MDIKDYAQMMRYLTRPRDVVPDPSTMDQEPRNMYGQGSSVDHAVRTVNPEQDSFKKLSNVLGAYRRYRRGEKNPKINFNQFFELYSTENFAEGGRTGFDKGGPLTGDKFKEIVTKYPDKTNQELLDYLNKNKFTNRYGEPLNLNVITTNKTKFFDLAAETKAKIPKNYIISTEVFENLPISKKDYFRVKQAKEGGTLLTKEIDKLLKPVKIGDTFYFKKPGKNDSRSFSRLADKTGRLNNRIADLMLDFDTTYGNKFFSKGNVPDIDDVAKKFNITDSTAGKVTTRLAQWYGGQDFKNPQLKDLKRNKVTSNRLFKTLEKSGFGNPYRNGLYQISMQTIDAKLGNKQGTFEKFKSQAKQILKDNKIAIYDPKMGKDAFGFNINEIAGVTGSAKSKAAEFSQFVDVMEGNINTKAMAGFQSKLSTARAAIEKDPTKLSVESKKINKMAKNLEKTYGVELPRLQDPDATKYFSPKRLNELKAQGLDIVKAAERAGYTIQMPKNAMTITEFTDPKNEKQIKKRLNSTVAKGGSKGKAAAQILTILAASTGAAVSDDGSEGTGGALKDAAIAGGAVGTVATKGGRKLLGNLFNAAGLPASLAFNYYAGIDGESSLDRAILGLELGTAQSTIGAAVDTTKKIKKPILRKAAELVTTISPKYALNVAKQVSPIGKGIMAGELAYKVATESNPNMLRDKQGNALFDVDKADTLFSNMLMQSDKKFLPEDQYKKQYGDKEPDLPELFIEKEQDDSGIE